MLKFEKELFDKGIKYIAGVDEVGRGPLAGPMVVSAVILNLEHLFKPAITINSSLSMTLDELISVVNNDVEWKKTYGKINDSKKMTEKARNLMEKFIKDNCLAFSIIEISHTQIDETGIGPITNESFFNSIKNLKIAPEHILTDAFKIKNLPDQKQTNIIEGDRTSITVAAASIVAKVYRDSLMVEYSKRYPEYRFAEHKGYGTKVHMEMLNKFGPCEIHRKSFSPVRELLNK